MFKTIFTFLRQQLPKLKPSWPLLGAAVAESRRAPESRPNARMDNMTTTEHKRHDSMDIEFSKADQNVEPLPLTNPKRTTTMQPTEPAIKRHSSAPPTPPPRNSIPPGTQQVPRPPVLPGDKKK